MTTPIWAMGLVALGAFMGAVGQIFLKKGSAKFGFNIKEWFRNYWLIAGICMYLASTFPFIYAVKHGELSVLYPVVATSYIWAVLFAQKIFDEKMNGLKWLGIILIIAGVSLIAV
ncbi:EamA family transporter [Candidatus Woesearchaeota archaeon]|nr:EamA family transporter [Candidatus Woesearchaeota archaeon]